MTNSIKLVNDVIDRQNDFDATKCRPSSSARLSGYLGQKISTMK